MSAYDETPDKKIQADFALRIGKIFLANERNLIAMDPEEKFDATLTLVLLHSLLVTCSELMKKSPFSKDFDREFTDIPGCWGLRREMIVRNTSNKKLTFKYVINKIRNALSHPSYGDVDNQYPLSGFKNFNDKSGNIVGFSFVDSPHVTDEGSMMSYNSEKASNELMKYQKQLTGNASPIVLSLKKKENGKFIFMFDDKPYIDVFQINVPMPALKTLLQELSNYLSQPSQKNWDGKKIVQLVA